MGTWKGIARGMWAFGAPYNLAVSQGPCRPAAARTISQHVTATFRDIPRPCAPSGSETPRADRIDILVSYYRRASVHEAVDTVPTRYNGTFVLRLPASVLTKARSLNKQPNQNARDRQSLAYCMHYCRENGLVWRGIPSIVAIQIYVCPDICDVPTTLFLSSLSLARARGGAEARPPPSLCPSSQPIVSQAHARME